MNKERLTEQQETILDAVWDAMVNAVAQELNLTPAQAEVAVSIIKARANRLDADNLLNE